MKAMVITRLGGPEVLELVQVPEPQPGAAEALVKVDCAGVNFADIRMAQGTYPGGTKPPIIAGREFAGTLLESSERVMGYVQKSAFAELVAASRQLLWPIPQGWSAAEAAAFPVNYFTAYLLYWQAGMLERPAVAGPGRVLIHAVAGGVGTAAVKIGSLLGVEMFGTSSSDEKLARVKQLGLQHGINYRDVDYEQALAELTRGAGVDAVFEMLGGEHTAKSTRCLADFGRVIIYGSATGKPPEFDVRAMYSKTAMVQGLWLSVLSGKPAIMKAAWERLSQWMAQGKLRPEVGHTLPLERAADAFRLLLERKNYGKVVLKV